jgi:hypothetical protein
MKGSPKKLNCGSVSGSRSVRFRRRAASAYSLSVRRTKEKKDEVLLEEQDVIEAWLNF